MIAAAISLQSCDEYDELQPGDLLFQTCRSSDFVDAINGATANEATQYAHVGIYDVVDGCEVVIEANTKRGVVLTPLDSFLLEPVVAMRVDPGVADAEAAALRARSMAGRPYDWEFDEANDKVYCSELVQLAYIGRDGKRVFESIPMNFMAADTMPQFWIDLFAELGKPIPQGQPGTNPNSLATSPALRVLSWPISKSFPAEY